MEASLSVLAVTKKDTQGLQLYVDKVLFMWGQTDGSRKSRPLWYSRRDQRTSTFVHGVRRRSPSILGNDRIRQSHSRSATSSLITLPDFLDALYDLGKHGSAEALRIDLLKAWVNFTRFLPQPGRSALEVAEGHTALTRSELLEAWLRREAYVTPHGNPIYDFAIPTYSGALDGPLEHSNLGVIFVQAKCRMRGGRRAQVPPPVSAGTIPPFRGAASQPPSILPLGHPPVMLWLELGSILSTAAS